jgi:hypothetical protein
MKRKPASKRVGRLEDPPAPTLTKDELREKFGMSIQVFISPRDIPALKACIMQATGENPLGRISGRAALLWAMRRVAEQLGLEEVKTP